MQLILEPAFPWEFIQVGNCGSPIEKAGWLVIITAGGRMRKYCIGAFLLDREDPGKVIGRYTRALQLRGPGWPQVVSFMGMAAAHRSAGRLQEAEDWARKVLAENPDMASTHRWEARYAFDIGDRARMAKAVERMRRLHPDASVSLLVACDPRADLHWLDAMAGAGLPL